MDKRGSYVLILLISVGITLSYDLKCPQDGHRPIRAKIRCDSPQKYTCLLIATKGLYEEGCRMIDRPREEIAGSRTTLNFYNGSTNYDAKECTPGRYQPYDFSTAKQSDCMFLKSPCNEEGQLLVNDSKIESSKSDVSCACDIENGYRFVTTPINKCFCIPSEEDCACVRVKCKNGWSKGKQSCLDDIEDDCKAIAVMEKQRDVVVPMANIPLENNNLKLGFSNDTVAFYVLLFLVLMIVAVLIIISQSEKLEAYVQRILKDHIIRSERRGPYGDPVNPHVQNVDSSSLPTSSTQSLSREVIAATYHDFTGGHDLKISSRASNVQSSNGKHKPLSKASSNETLSKTSNKESLSKASSNESVSKTSNKESMSKASNKESLSKASSTESLSKASSNESLSKASSNESFHSVSETVVDSSTTRPQALNDLVENKGHLDVSDDHHLVKIQLSDNGGICEDSFQNKEGEKESNAHPSRTTIEKSSDNEDICDDSSTYLLQKDESGKTNLTLTKLDKSKIEGAKESELEISGIQLDDEKDVQVQTSSDNNVDCSSTDMSGINAQFEDLGKFDDIVDQDTLSSDESLHVIGDNSFSELQRNDQHTASYQESFVKTEEKISASKEEKNDGSENSDNGSKKNESNYSLHVSDQEGSEDLDDSNCSDKESLDKTKDNTCESDKESLENT